MTDSSGVRFRGGRRGTREVINLDDDYKSDRFPDMELPNYVAYGFLLVLVLFVKFFSYMPEILPAEVTIAEEHAQPDRFIGQRAESFLKRLTDIGTRVTGSYQNEVLTLDLLQREISFIVQQANPIHKIETDIQKTTGSFTLPSVPQKIVYYYANVQNVVVKFSSSSSKRDSVLLNCHFDSRPESPGASDNGLNCAVLLEILTKFSKLKTPLHNTVIFLFNGAEETGLKAAHGFITQHKWSKSVRAVINLDSAGAGGKEMLFQTTSTVPWIAETYAEVVWHPSGNVMGEEVFQSGVIPSDTDFRVFRDIGKIPGLDLAHARNGYVYHTKSDKMDYITEGTIQHTGDNILALARKLASSPELGQLFKPEDSSNWKMVYYDVFGLFMVIYNELTAIIINLGTAVFSLFTIYRTFSILSGILNIFCVFAPLVFLIVVPPCINPCEFNNT